MDELLQILLQCRIGIDRLLAAPAWTPDATVTSSCWSFELFDTPTDGLPGHTRGARCAGDPPRPNGLGLCSCHQATGPLIKVGSEKLESVSYRLFIGHCTLMVQQEDLISLLLLLHDAPLAWREGRLYSEG